MIRNTFTWMRFYVEHEIRRRHPQLLKDLSKHRGSDWVSRCFNRKHWYNATALAALLIFLIGGIVYFTGICLEYGTFIDQRASNLATISGMCLSVIVFLMSNLAVKETYAYDLLFEKTKLYPAIFFVLSTLGIFILLSTLRNSLGFQLYRSLVIASGFMFLLILGIIGFLFRTVIHYINPIQIDKFMSAKLKNRADKIFYVGLIQKISKERFISIVRQQGLNDYVKSYAFEESIFKFLKQQSAQAESIAQTERMFISDINTTKLTGLAAELKSHGYYHELFLGQETDQYDNFLIQWDSPNNEAQKNELKSILILEKRKNDIPLVSEVRQHFDERIPQHSEAGKSTDLGRLLDGMGLVYDDQIRYRTNSPFDLTENFSGILHQAFSASIDKNTIACFTALWNFYFIKSYAALIQKYYTMFQDLLWLHRSIYLMGIQKNDNPGYKTILGYALTIYDSYDTYFDALEQFEQDTPNDLQIKQEFATLIYRQFSDILFNMLHFRDVKGIKKAMEMLDKKEKNPVDIELRLALSSMKRNGFDENKIGEYRVLKSKYRASKFFRYQQRRMIYGVKAWTYHMLRLKQIDAVMAERLTSNMLIRNDDSLDPLEDLLFFRSGTASLGYLGWLNKSFGIQTEDTDDIQFYNPGDWLTFGFMIEQIRHFTLPSYLDEVDLEEFQSFDLIKGDLEAAKGILLKDFDTWSKILKVATPDELAQKADHLINFLTSLELKRETAERKRIALADIDNDFVKEEISKAALTWKKSARIFEIFRSADILVPSEADLPFIGHSAVTQGNKSMFIHGRGNQNLGILPSLGMKSARLLNEGFFSHVLHHIPLKGEFSSFLNFIQYALPKMDKAKPDAIFASSYDVQIDNDLWDDEKFQVVQHVGYDNELRIFGYYENIPIYLVHESFLGKRIIIANIKKAISLEYKKDVDLIDDYLRIELQPISDIEAGELVKRRYSSTLSPEVLMEKKYLVQNDLHIDIGIYGRYKIVDKEALMVGGIRPNRADNIALQN